MEQLAHSEDAATASQTVPYSVDAHSVQPYLEGDNVEEPWIIDGSELMRATRLWLQYGLVGFTIFCILVGAVEALFGQ